MPVVAAQRKFRLSRSSNAASMERVTAKNLGEFVRKNVDSNAALHTDEWAGYTKVGKEFAGGHHVVNHSKREYARADGTTVNSAEAFFALLKRGVMGSFHHISKQHLDRYVTEFGFRWDHRKTSDSERTVAAIKASEGKRLMYKHPTAKNI
jgi:hypothetical protein